MPFSPLVSELRRRLGTENVLSAPSELTVYDCDALTIARNPPDVVVFPRSTRHVVATVRACRDHGTPRDRPGAGTGLAGGCTAHRGGVVLSLARMNRVLEVDLRNRMAVVEPGVPNLQLAQALAGTGYHFAPDPSSQGASTIGGNVATNAGGPHTLLYGVTVNHLLGLEAVLSNGAVVATGAGPEIAALDLAGLLCGSEGTLAIVTKVWVRLDAQSAGLPHPAGGVQQRRGRRQQRHADHRRGHHPGRHGIDGSRHPWGGRRGLSLRLSARDGRRAGDRGGRSFGPRVRARPEAAADHRHLPPQPGRRDHRGRHAGGARIAVEVPQIGGRRRGPPQPQLPHRGRRGAADATAAHLPPDRRDRQPAPGSHRQRRPCRRRQRASDPAVRRARPRPGRPGHGRRPRGAPGVHRLRRQHHGRARRGHREARPDGQPVRAGRPGGHAAGARGRWIRSGCSIRESSCRRRSHRHDARQPAAADGDDRAGRRGGRGGGGPRGLRVENARLPHRRRHAAGLRRAGRRGPASGSRWPDSTG